MPFERPELTTLRQTADADFAARFGLTALIPRGALVAISRVTAGQAHGLYGHQATIARQILPDTADGPELERHASNFGIFRKPADPAEGLATVLGPDGTLLLDGALLRRSDGIEFQVDGDQVIPFGSGGTLDAAVRGVLGGTIENTTTGATLTFTTPVEGVNQIATVVAPGLVNGFDAETDAQLLDRLLVRLRNAPQGGSKADYLGWALEVPGVTRSYVFPDLSGPGTVGVTFTVDDDPDGPIPDAGQVAEVQAFIDDDTRKPVTATVTVFAPTEKPIGFLITLIPDDLTVRAAVEANLDDLIKREAGPGQTLLLTHVAEAISTTPGEVDHIITFPVADTVVTETELGTIGTITWG